MGFQLLPHTADIRLKATGNTVEELFDAALKGMSQVQRPGLCKPHERPTAITTPIQLSADNVTNLLIDFLSEVLTHCSIGKVVYCQALFLTLSYTELSAILYGKRVDHFDRDIKAVTYHEADVKMNNEKQFETIVLFDI